MEKMCTRSKRPQGGTPTGLSPPLQTTVRPAGVCTLGDVAVLTTQTAGGVWFCQELGL